MAQQCLRLFLRQNKNVGQKDMQLLEQIVALVTGLAWPVVVLLIVRMFRDPLTALIANVRKVKAKDLEIDISREIQQVAVLAQESEELKAPPQLNLFEAWAPVRIGAVSPAAGIFEAWKQIELAGMRAIRRAFPDVTEDRPSTPINFALFLNARNMLSPTSVRVIEQLRRIRNQAAHDQNFAITKQELEEYLNTAVRIFVKLEDIAQQGGGNVR